MYLPVSSVARPATILKVEPGGYPYEVAQSHNGLLRDSFLPIELCSSAVRFCRCEASGVGSKEGLLQSALT